LKGPREAGRRSKQLGGSGDADCLLSSIQIGSELPTAVPESGASIEVVVSDLVPAGLDRLNHLGMVESSLANEEERTVGAILRQDGKHLGGVDGVRTIIER
jgi:hypothetical protein